MLGGMLGKDVQLPTPSARGFRNYLGPVYGKSPGAKPPLDVRYGDDPIYECSWHHREGDSHGLGEEQEERYWSPGSPVGRRDHRRRRAELANNGMAG